MLISGNGQSFSNSRNNTRMNILNIPIKHLDIQNINVYILHIMPHLAKNITKF